MLGIFDWIQTAMGRPDPMAQIYAGVGQAPGQPGNPTGAQPIPGPQAGAGQPGGGGPPGQPPTAGGPPAASQGQPATPQLYQSPPDMMQAYLTLMQHNRAEDTFNRSLAGMAAALYPGRHPEIAMQSVPPAQDAGAIFSNLMQMQMWAQQQRQQQAYENALPDVAKQLGITVDEARAYGPNAIATAINMNAPPEAMRNWLFAKKQYIAAHPEDPTGAQFEQQFPMSMAIVGAIPGLNDTDRQRVLTLQNWQQRNPGQTPPTWLTNTVAFQNYQKELGDAQGNFSSLNQRSQEAIDTIERIKSNPNLGSALKVLSTTGGAGSNFGAMIGAMDPQTKQAIDDIQMLSGQVYGEGFRATGSRRTQQEVQAIVEGLSKLGKTGYSADDYKTTVLNPVEQRIQKGMANNYGAAQQLDAMPDNLKPLVDKIYLRGGSMYGGQGGDSWNFQGMSQSQRQAAYDQLPSGAVYIDIDGQPHRKT